MIRYPNIVGKNTDQKLSQMASYLHQLADELNFQLDHTGNLMSGFASTAVDVGTVPKPIKKDNAISNFNDIKALIIKSADIVNAYYAEITKLIEKNNLYAAESDFGTFKEATENTLYADGTGLTQQVSSIQTIFDEDGNIVEALVCNGSIRSGIIYDEDGNTVVGIELGQKYADASGNTYFNQFARFTANKLSFYDVNGNEVAYISDRRLYITEVQITSRLTMGHFVDIVQADGSIITKYVKGGA